MTTEVHETTPDGRWPVVRCIACDAAFPVDPMKVPEEGVLARCSECACVFPVDRPHWPTEEVATAPDPVAGAEEEVPTSVSHDPGPDLPPLESYGDPPPPAVPADVPWSSFDAGLPTVDPTPEEPPELEPELPEAQEEMPELEPELPEAQEEPEPAVQAPERPAFSFGRSDPDERAARLARVLVSDMITYHRDQYDKALANGTLVEDFEEEIRRSREEYVDRVGQEMADSTNYFRDALNEILARGDELF